MPPMPPSPRTALATLALASLLSSPAWADAGALPAQSVLAAGLAQPALPKAEDLFSQYVDALGGEKATKAVTYRITDGTVERKDAEGKNTLFLARLTIWQEAPQKMRAMIEQPGVRTVEFGYDGTTAWSVDSVAGLHIMTGAERDQVIDSALFMGDADYKSRYKTVQTVAQVQFNAKPAYQVRCTPIYGNEASFVYFDPQTHLIVGTENDPAPDAEGKTQPKTTTLISDYKKFGDMFFPTRISQSRADAPPLVTVYRSIEVNPTERPAIKAPEAPPEKAAPAAGSK